MKGQGLNVRSRAVSVWLFSVAIVVLAMVVVGGATRLTGSGLSITQWRPVSGALPPLSARAWSEDFALYKATPQYRLVNPGMTLAGFKFIFWWEWSHRLLGRLVGLVFAIPLAVFIVLGAIPRRLVWRCVGLFCLGGLLGAVGWWMVKSGLETRTSVAPERLATHLGLALLLLAGLVWTGLEAWAGPPAAGGRRPGGWAVAGATLAAAVYVQCLLGALVAGNHGGLVDGDWPMMGGRIFPEDYWRASPWTTWVENPVAAQFDHRMLGYGIVILAIGLAIAAVRARNSIQGVTVGVAAICGLILLQAGLGVLTLLGGVPFALALAHQLGAALLLSASVFLAWRTRRL